MRSPQAILVFDGDCGICRTWVDYWATLTGDRIVYRPYQEAAAEFPQIPVSAFKRAIQLIEADGRVSSGAAATFRVLDYAASHGVWWWLYAHVPGFAPASERAYTFFSRRRGLLAGLTRTLWGTPLEPDRYALVAALFMKVLGAIYFAAFASLSVQILALIGSKGILPVHEYLDAAREGWGIAAYWRLPTLFWLNAGDATLLAGTITGMGLAALVMLGLWVRPALVGLYVLYLSCVYAGQIFTSYQWDLLLLEAGFLAIFLVDGSRVVVWLYRWLFFRFMFLSGAVKLLSAHPAWRDWTALEYHLWTQPLPMPLAWAAARLPKASLSGATAAVLIVELVLPFLIFLPRRPRALAALCFSLFQIAIMLTGNYGFFNLLTIALCLFLLDDKALRRLLPVRAAANSGVLRPRPTRAATTAAIALALALVVVPVGANDIWKAFAGHDAPLAGGLSAAIAPLLIVNDYGPFATTTRTRPEIVIEGSDDGRDWREYVFRYKPGPVDRAPRWNIPHQPRLDWQMWFAAYGTAAENPWFGNLVRRILEGSPDVLARFAVDPFKGRPPKFVRALLYDYRFAGPGSPPGIWWVRRETGIYFPETDLAAFEREVTPQPPVNALSLYLPKHKLPPPWRVE